MITDEDLAKPHFQVMVGFYPQAETEEEAIKKVADLLGQKLIHETDYPEAWTAKPWDMLG